MIHTVGHSNHALDHFLETVRAYEVEVIADVRSRPFSRFVPHFSKRALEATLPAEGLGYLFLGEQLGGKPPRGDGPALPYAERIRQSAFQDGIARLQAAAAGRRVALMCRERDPLDCHRLHLICRYLAPTGTSLGHILPDGGIEAHADTERRLLERTAADRLPLFDQDHDALERAYDACWARGR